MRAKLATFLQKAARLRGELAWVVAGRFLNLLGAVISLKLLTMMLSLEEFGRFGLAIAGANAGAMLLFSALGQGVFRFTQPLVAQTHGADARVLFHRILPALAAFAGLVAAIPLAVIIWAEAFGIARSDWPILAMGGALMVLLGVQLCTFNAVQAMRMRRLTAALQVMSGMSRGLIAAPLVAFIAPTAEAAVAGVLAFVAVQVFIQSRAVNRYVIVPSGTGSDAGFGPSLRSFCLPFVLIFALDMIVQYADKFIVASVLTIQDLAVIVAFQQIARAVSLFCVGVTTQMLFPIIFGAGEARDAAHRKVWLAYLLVISAMIAFSAAIWSVSVPVVRFLTTEDYVPQAYLLPSLILAYAVARSARILQAQGMVDYSSLRYAAPKFAEAVVVVLILLALLPVMGAIAVPVAISAGGLVLTFGYIWVNRGK